MLKTNRLVPALLISALTVWACDPPKEATPPSAVPAQATTPAVAPAASKPPSPPEPATTTQAKEEEKPTKPDAPQGEQPIYAISLRDGALYVEHIKVSALKEGELERLNEGLDGALLPLETSKLPKALTALKGYEILTKTGAARADRIKGWLIEGGAGRMHIYHVLEVPESLAEWAKGEQPFGYAFDYGRLPEKAKVEVHQAQRLEERWEPKADKAKIDALRAQLKALIEEHAKKPEDKKALAKLLKGHKWLKHVQLIEGSFGGKRAKAITFSLPRAEDAPEDGYISGLYFTDQADQNIEVYAAPAETWEGLALMYSVDVDGDGQEELVYSSFYYEGNHTYLLMPDERGALVSQLLEGDGA